MIEVGDEELLAPAAGPEPLMEDTDEAAPDTGEDSSSDSEGIVRVWLKEGRLDKVRVSPLWHLKLGRRRLEDCFTEALALASIRVAPSRTAASGTFDSVDFGPLPRLSSQSLAAFHVLFDEVEQRWDQALQRRDDDRPASRAATTATYKGATVSLDDAGWVKRVSFDKAWLDDAQAGTICSHVMRAATAAYDRYVPADQSDAELDEVQYEHEYLQAAFKAMMNPKER